MFVKHVSKKLSAYLHDELTVTERVQVAAHLRACSTCRDEYEEIRLGVEYAKTMTLTEAPDALWTGIEARLVKNRRGDSRQLQGLHWWTHLPVPARWMIPLAATLLIVLGVGRLFQRSGEGWEVTPLAGNIRVGSNLLQTVGHLRVGDWLRTDSGARARLSVANIGRLTIEPESRLRLLETGPSGHRLELERGAIDAVVTAPPRIFLVQTPSAVAVDLGCAYRLSVDASGGSLLEVRAGWVALEDGGRESLVPAGAVCLTLPKFGPGTPVFSDASPRFRAAMRSLDFENGGSDALHEALELARPRDTLSLWHLLSRVDRGQRSAVYETMATLSPPPRRVTQEQIELLNPGALEAWREDLQRIW